MKINDSDLFFTCSLIELIGRTTKQKRSAVTSLLGKKVVSHIFVNAGVLHCEPIAKTAEVFIGMCNIPVGNFDNVADCKYEVPDYWTIGKVFARLIEDVTSGDVVETLIEVYSSPICDAISNFNSDFFYQPRGFIKEYYLEECKSKPAKRKTPVLRFSGFTDAWEQRKAKEIFVATVDKGHPELPVLSATQDRGMIRRDENSINIFHDKKNEAGYKRVLPGQFVIHLRSFQGGFAHSTIEGITSPAYTVFGFSETEKHNSEYWKYVFTSKTFIRRLESVTYGIRDGRSISYEEFLTWDFIYPSYEEQTAIAGFLDTLNGLITLHQREQICDEL